VEQTLFIPQIGKIEAKSVIPELKKIEANRTGLIPEIGKIEARLCQKLINCRRNI
jgi:hypothetical protein